MRVNIVGRVAHRVRPFKPRLAERVHVHRVYSEQIGEQDFQISVGGEDGQRVVCTLSLPHERYGGCKEDSGRGRVFVKVQRTSVVSLMKVAGIRVNEDILLIH